jgi:hypothetical protein
LMRKREYIAASGFQTMAAEPAPLTFQQIQSMVVSEDYNFYNGACNTQAIQNGQSYVSVARTLGSQASSSCVSRFGAQDLIGNGSILFSDQLSCVSNVCTGIQSSVDSGNRDLVGNPSFTGGSYSFNDSTAPGASSINQEDFVTNVNIGNSQVPTGWFPFSYGTGYPIGVTSNAEYFSPPLGLPFISQQGSLATSVLTSNLLNNTGELFVGGVNRTSWDSGMYLMDTGSQDSPVEISSLGYTVNEGYGNYSAAITPGRFSFDATNQWQTDIYANIIEEGSGVVRCAIPAEGNAY